MPLSESVLVIIGLLTLAIVAAGLFRNLPIPYTVLLVVLGLGLGELANVWPAISILQEFRLQPDLVFFGFLPALIFESGFNLNARQLIKDLVPVLVLAVPALLISTLLVGWGLSIVLGVPIMLALVFGALISATDPVAVVALFKELGAPLRLNVLVEGEALLNDATAIVVFGILLSMAVAGTQLEFSSTALAVVDFFRVFVGGALVGLAVGFVLSELLHLLRTGTSGILVISIVMAYSSFILAEHVLHVSGVMASASAALTLGVYGVTRVSSEATQAIGETWELIALVANSLLFLLVGLSVDPIALALRADVIAIAVLLVLIARAATIYSLVPATTRLFRLPRISMGERHIMWWGGLKGGLAIAIVLSIPETLAGRDMLLDMTLGVVLFTLLVNAPTIRPFMVKLGLNRLTEEEQSELKQTLTDARQRAEETLERFQQSGILSRAEQHRVNRQIEETLESDLPEIGHQQFIRHVHLEALKVEQGVLDELYEIGVIAQYTYLDMRSNIQRDREARRVVAAAENETAAKGFNLFLKLEMSMLRRLREKDWASGLLARYQSVRLAQRFQHSIAGILTSMSVLEMLDSRDDLDAKQKGEIAKPYEQRLSHRRRRVDLLRSEFPTFYERFVTRLCARAAFNSAARKADQDYGSGAIGAKALTSVERWIHEALCDLPPISEALPTLSPAELINLVPLFSELSEHALASLAARARSVTFLPGDTVIGQHERGDALYVITRGRVSVQRKEIGGSEIKLAELCDGEFFGETALLGDQVRTATVKATATTTLLRLSRRDVLALAKENSEVERRLEDAKSARGASRGS